MIKKLLLILFILTTPSFAEELPDFRLGKEMARTYFKKGVLQLNNFQYSAAKESFISSLSVMEDFHLARKMLSDAYYLGGEWQESLNELEILEDNSKLINPLWKNRAEILRLNISGIGKKEGLNFYKFISGDANRGYRFKNPTDALIDSEGNLYILSFGTTNIIKFDPNGLPIGNFKGGLGRTLEGPLFFTIHNEIIYITDFAGDRIYKMTPKGRLLDRFGESGIQPGKFHGPEGIAISKDNYIYVSDSGNNRVQKLTLEGKPVLVFNTEERSKLSFPSGVGIGDDDLIYVADKGNHRIVAFDDEGNFAKEITHPNMKMPRSIKFHNGRMYVADEINGLMIYSKSKDKWTKISTFRDTTGEYNKLLRPFSSAFDYTGSLYTVDYSRHRIDMFSTKSSLISNLNVFVERVELNKFPTVSLFLRIKNRSNQDLTGIRREAFRVVENSNLYPLVGLANMKEYNDQLSVSLVFENSQKIKQVTSSLGTFLGSFFSSLTVKDKVEVIRASKDSEKVYDFGTSPLDIFAKIRKSVPEKEQINLGKSLYQSISDLTPELGPRAVILLVSGEVLPNAFNQYNILRNIQFAKAHSIPIIILSLKDDGEMVSLYKEIASRTGGMFIKVPGSQDEKNIYSFIKSNKDKRYIISYKSKIGTELNGKYVDFESQVYFRDILGRAQGGYFVPENN
ncbi:MAG: NHL repeat-containing protein [Leptospiraceae bacterium]|nr:NHL repeat-containing protein [Leptospiraceae bacterium]